VQVALGDGPTDEVVRLDLRLLDGCAEVLWEALEIGAEGPAPEVLEFERPRNVVFWLIDAVRPTG